MKKIIVILSLFLLSHSMKAQETNSSKLKFDLAFLIADAAKGFPETFNSLTDNKPYGRYYSAKRALFGITERAGVTYLPPREKTKYNEAENEAFYFTQLFKTGKPYYDIRKDSLELILDGSAKEAGLKKIKIKSPKQSSFKWTGYQYAINKKTAFSIIYDDDDDNSIRLRVYSPFRPADVSPPLKTLGCIVISFDNFVYKYVAPVYGESMNDISSTATLAAKAFNNSGIVGKDYQYTWYPNKTVYDIQQMFKKPIVVSEIGGVTAK